MDSPKMAALLSSLISQITLLILLLYPSSSSSPPSDSHSETLFSLINHFLTSESALLFSNRNKRRRAHVSDPQTHQGTGPGSSKLGRLGRVDSDDPDSFRLLYKMSPATFEWLSGLLEPLLECRDPVDSPLNLPAELRLGIGLFRLSTGSGYGVIAERFRVSERVARFCSKQLCRVLCTNFRFWVGYPNSDEFDSVSKKFETLTGLPNCCGVIGCTRFTFIKTEDPNREPESIFAQIVVDSSSRIISIFAGCHGDKSNLSVLKSSTLYKDIEEEKSLLNSPPILIENVAIPQYLVGGFGYPLLPWLMVPFDEPKPESNEENYNYTLQLMQVSIQKTVASLKNWGILSKPMEDEELRNGVAYIGACAILHNALLLREDYSGLCDRVEDCTMIQDDIQPMMEGSQIEGSDIRNALATKSKDFSKIN